MIRTFFTSKAENLNKAEESSLTERMKERQSQKSKSIIEDSKYKDLLNCNNSTYRVNSPSEHSASKPNNNNNNNNYNSGRSNARSTSSYHGQNMNYNSFSINLNNNFGTSF